MEYTTSDNNWRTGGAVSIIIAIPTAALNPYFNPISNPSLKRNANPHRNRKPMCIPHPDTNVQNNAIPPLTLTIGLTLTVTPSVSITQPPHYSNF